MAHHEFAIDTHGINLAVHQGYPDERPGQASGDGGLPEIEEGCRRGAAADRCGEFSDDGRSIARERGGPRTAARHLHESTGPTHALVRCAGAGRKHAMKGALLATGIIHSHDPVRDDVHGTLRVSGNAAA